MMNTKKRTTSPSAIQRRTDFVRDEVEPELDAFDAGEGEAMRSG